VEGFGPGGTACYFVLRIFRTAETNRSRGVYRRGWDEPAPHVASEDEKKVTPVSGESFDNLVPALVAAPRADDHGPTPLFVDGSAGLYLDAKDLAVPLGDQVGVWAMADG
jgi:hypothetical protein